MALTGKGKLGVTILVAALIGGGAFYANKHKAIPVTTPPAIVEQVAPKQEQTAPAPESPIVAEQAPAPKKHKVSKKVGSIPHIKHDRDTLVHRTQKDSGKVSEDAALKELAGKDNL